MGFIAFIVCVALDVYIAALARERGRSFAGFLALGFFLSPVVSGIVLLAAGKKKRKPTEENCTDMPENKA